MTGYDFHPEALVDLDEIWEFIGADRVDAADQMIAEILRRCSRSGAFSPQRPQASDLTNRPLRFIRVRDYLIATRQRKSRSG